MAEGSLLVKRLTDGDESAFSEFIALYRAPLILFIDRYVGNLSAAEEIAADTLAEFLISPGKYNGKASVKTYLFTIGKHRAVDFLRQRVRRKELPIADDIPDTDDPAEILIDSEEKRRLHRAINQLHGDYKTAIWLVYFEDLSYKETAKIMKKSVKQVENLVYRAKKALKEQLEVER